MSTLDSSLRSGLDGHLDDAQAQRLLDGQLDPVRDAGVEAHAHGCAGCAALVESFRALGEALDGLELPPLPSDFTEGVLARIEIAEVAQARERRVAALVFATAALLGGLALAAAVSGGVVPAVTVAADQIGLAARAIRLGAGVLPGLLSAVRGYVLVAALATGLPLVYGLARLMPAPRAVRA